MSWECTGVSEHGALGHTLGHQRCTEGTGEQSGGWRHPEGTRVPGLSQVCAPRATLPVPAWVGVTGTRGWGRCHLNKPWDLLPGQVAGHSGALCDTPCSTGAQRGCVPQCS